MCGGEAGIDPYTRAVSDVYQDVFGEGSFIGKGIYDVDAFEQSLKGRFPENRILSHDLLEGCYARAGLLSDVELFETDPALYSSDVKRRTRWIRGDWQILRWLLPRVPSPAGRSVRNPLSALSRWKIFDNLRRSLVPAAATLLLLFLAWCRLSAALAVDFHRGRHPDRTLHPHLSIRTLPPPRRYPVEPAPLRRSPRHATPLRASRLRTGMSSL